MIGDLLEFILGVGFEVARESGLKKDFVPSAVEIARYQGWVSPHRMSSQVGLSRRDAQIVLFSACRQGLLYQAVNGRFYLAPSPPIIEPVMIKRVVIEPPAQPIDIYAHEKWAADDAARRKKVAMVLGASAALVIGAVFIWVAVERSDRAQASASQAAPQAPIDAPAPASLDQPHIFPLATPVVPPQPQAAQLPAIPRPIPKHRDKQRRRQAPTKRGDGEPNLSGIY